MNVYQNVNVTGDATVSGKVTAQTLEANALGANAQAAVKALISAAYPVGAYYWSGAPTDPGSFIGGTWEQITGKFLLASDDVLENGVITTAGTYHVGATGGEATHTLTIAEMPSHNHSETVAGRTSTGDITWARAALTYQPDVSASGCEIVGSSEYKANASNRAVLTTEFSGGGAAHNNMPPYVVGYLWKRIA